MTTSRACARCHSVKSAEDFFHRGKFYKQLCRDCVAEDEKSPEMRTCRTCNMSLPIVKFNMTNKVRCGECTQCKSNRAAKWAAIRAASPKTIAPEKRCSKCGVIKKSHDFNNHAASKDGLQSRCKACFKEADFIQARHRVIMTIAEIPITFSHIQRMTTKFRVGYDVITKTLIRCDGRCEICNRTFKSRSEMAVDHNHTSGDVRGILCHRCNLVLGHSLDNVNTLKNAVIYLQRADRSTESEQTVHRAVVVGRALDFAEDVQIGGYVVEDGDVLGEAGRRTHPGQGTEETVTDQALRHI